MRRHDIQLLALARQGDAAARIEAGRRYFVGGDGFPKHILTGIDYLTHSSLCHHPAPPRIISEYLPLEQILLLGQSSMLERAATSGSGLAQLKLGIWLCVQQIHFAQGLRWIEESANSGSKEAHCALEALHTRSTTSIIHMLLAMPKRERILDPAQVSLAAARLAQDSGDPQLLTDCLRVALALSGSLTPALAALVTSAVRMTERSDRSLRDLAASCIEESLEIAISEGDCQAAYILGRATCGIAVGAMVPRELATTRNMRKGVAMLLRAADGGCDDAWMYLFQMHADHRSSVSNPQMARFFLEKAAGRGNPEAQRKLGALILRSASNVSESEQAIHWLHTAAQQGDAHANQLLRSLVLPLQGDDSTAASAIEYVQRTDPWLAARLSLSREFGLTKLEALCVDPVDGRRSWGLLVGVNHFISHSRLSAARAVPAVKPGALERLRNASTFFAQSQKDKQEIEGDLRRRSARQRRTFARIGLSESMFFARVNSTKLESFKVGAKWASRARDPLEKALAENEPRVRRWSDGELAQLHA